ncbi:MAG: PAC2 family protein [Nanoarchaeota archaeon]|nr:PAC2 family protein [Nanoarchaeota archaeon]
MRYKLKVKPKSPVIIEGFPGFGLVGTIATEFLIEHLGATKIGYIRMEEIPPVVAVHASRPVDPLGIFYSKKKNIVILHALANMQGFEWEISDVLVKIAKELKAKEIISLEGVGSQAINTSKEPKAYYLSDSKKFKSKHGEPLVEGILVGVTGALMLRDDILSTGIFAETDSSLPDSRAAAKILCVLDEYLKLNLDYSPLLKKAEMFEKRLKGVISKSQEFSTKAEKRNQTYFG